MALYTTNLTTHIDASDTTRAFSTFVAGGSHTGAPPGDGVATEVLKYQADSTNTTNSYLYCYSPASTSAPLYKSTSTPMVRTCVYFDGVGNTLGLYGNSGSPTGLFSDVFSVSAKGVIIALRIVSASLNSANPWENHVVFTDTHRECGILVRKSGSQHYIYAYNYSGSAATVEFAVNANTDYVMTLTHNGTNLIARLSDGQTGSTASGATDSDSGQETIGGYFQVYYSDQCFNGYVGEVGFWNEAISGTNMTDSETYFTGRWIAASSLVKTVSGLAKASVKTVNGLAIASVKTVNGLTNV